MYQGLLDTIFGVSIYINAREELVLKGYLCKGLVFRNSSESSEQCGTAINGINCSSNGVIERTAGGNWNEITFARNARKHTPCMRLERPNGCF